MRARSYVSFSLLILCVSAFSAEVSVDARVEQCIMKLALKLPPPETAEEKGGRAGKDKANNYFGFSHMAGIAKRELVPLGAEAVPALLKNINFPEVKIRCVIFEALNQISHVYPDGLNTDDLVDARTFGRERMAHAFAEWHARVAGTYAAPDPKFVYSTRLSKVAIDHEFKILDHHAEVLFSDGKVGIFISYPGGGGGGGGPAGGGLMLFDPATETSEVKNPTLIGADPGTQAIPLPEDRVLLLGDNKCIIFDYKTNKYAKTHNEFSKRCYGFARAILPDGKVFICGGDYGKEVSTACFVFDPQSDMFNKVGNLKIPRTLHSATLLDEHTVLIVGGTSTANDFSGHATIELYDLEKNKSEISKARLSRKRCMHTAAKLGDGTVLIAGGVSGTEKEDCSSAELFEPQETRCVALPDMAIPRGEGVCSAPLSSGRIAVFAGKDLSRLVEIYCPKERRFIPAQQLMLNPRKLFDATPLLLPSGDLLLVGGRVGQAWEGLSTLEFFSEKSSGPAATPPAPAAPKESASANWSVEVREGEKILETLSLPATKTGEELEIFEKYKDQKSKVSFTLHFPTLYVNSRQGELLNNVGTCRFPQIKLGEPLKAK